MLRRWRLEAHDENAMDSGPLVHTRFPLSPSAEVAVRWPPAILDALMFSLSASLTLWADLTSVEVAMLLIILSGTMLGGGE